MKTPLCCVLSVYTNSETAVAAWMAVWSDFFLRKVVELKKRRPFI
jgi:hypothetical protein